MARCSRAAAGTREGAHPARRRARGAATRAALGAGGEGVPLRYRRRREVARRAVRRTIPAARLPLHVRPKLRGGLPGQLVDRRQRRRGAATSACSRRDVLACLTSTAGEAAALQAPHGLEPSLGVDRTHRLQLRPRLLAYGATGPAGGGADDRERATADR